MSPVAMSMTLTLRRTLEPDDAICRSVHAGLGAEQCCEGSNERADLDRRQAPSAGREQDESGMARPEALPIAEQAEMVDDVGRHDRPAFRGGSFDDPEVRSSAKVAAIGDGLHVQPRSSKLARNPWREMLVEEEPHPGRPAVPGIPRARAATARLRSIQRSISAGWAARYASAASTVPTGISR